jgi:hypothetical protein
MAWNVPVTWVDGVAVTAAQLNGQIRDNLNETAAAKATTPGRIFAATGTNTIAEREIKQTIENGTGTRTSTSYGALTGGGTGPLVSVTTGVLSLIFMNARMENSTGGVACWACFEIGGATTDAHTDTRAILQQAGAGDANRIGATSLNTVTAGVNTYNMEYRVTSGTGTYQDRRLSVMAL